MILSYIFKINLKTISVNLVPGFSLRGYALISVTPFEVWLIKRGENLGAG